MSPLAAERKIIRKNKKGIEILVLATRGTDTVSSVHGSSLKRNLVE